MNKNDTDIVGWMTVKGNHIPIRKGQTKADAMNAFLSENDSNDPFEKKSNPDKPEKAYGFANKERKNTKHHRNHVEELGFKDGDDYEQGAIFFWEKGEGKIYKGKRRDDFAKYNPKTQEYVVVDKMGNVKTFYKMTVKKFKHIQIQEGFEEWIE